jgi:8-hydroxy-5-deazaflavin:NADPH oxidoreductase
MASKVGVIGSGEVGQVLSDGFLKHGWEVIRGTREPAKLESWKAGVGPDASVGTLAETAAFGDVVVLAVKGAAAESIIDQAGPDRLAGKTVIDTTNPLAESAPVNGVLAYFTGPNESLMERLQRRAPQAHLVKAFSIVGNRLMVNPELPGGPPTMFICGKDEGAKEETRGILDSFGWQTEDLGGVEAARAIEPLCMLWCIPGFRQNRWAHAFKLLEAG